MSIHLIGTIFEYISLHLYLFNLNWICPLCGDASAWAPNASTCQQNRPQPNATKSDASELNQSKPRQTQQQQPQQLAHRHASIRTRFRIWFCVSVTTAAAHSAASLLAAAAKLASRRLAPQTVKSKIIHYDFREERKKKKRKIKERKKLRKKKRGREQRKSFPWKCFKCSFGCERVCVCEQLRRLAVGAWLDDLPRRLPTIDLE